MTVGSRLAFCLGPVLALTLGACETMEDFARGVDDLAATIIPNDRQTTAAENEADRLYQLGIKHLNGDDVPRNEQKAAVLFRDAATKGSSDAQLQLGLLHQRGRGVTQDDRAALSFFEKAGAAGNAEAQYLTGQAHASGRGTGIDHAWAARWYGKAAEQGLAKAQYSLGTAYASGRGVPRDRITAYAWLNLAAARKEQDAMRERDSLARKMSKSELEQAEKHAREWRPASTAQFLDPPTVRFAQVALADLGFPPGPIDGQVGQRTRNALIAYQAKAGMPPDGTLTPAVVEKLRSDRLPAAAIAKSTR